MEHAEFEIRCDGEAVAWASGPRDEALEDSRHYAGIYAQDGQTEIYEVRKTFTLVK